MEIGLSYVRNHIIWSTDSPAMYMNHDSHLFFRHRVCKAVNSNMQALFTHCVLEERDGVLRY